MIQFVAITLPSEPERGTQCSAIAGTRGGFVFCTRRRKHKGDHRGYRKQWRRDEKGEVTHG